MENPKPKWQWPTKRLDQVILVAYTLLLLGVIYMLTGQLLAGKRLHFSPPVLWETIAVTGVALGASIFATQKRSWKTLGSTLFWWSIAAKQMIGYAPVDRRFFLEVLVSVLFGTATMTKVIAILRGEWNENVDNEQNEHHATIRFQWKP